MEIAEQPDRLAGLPDRVRLPLAFDSDALAADLAAFDEADWTRHFVRSNYEGEWSAIPLRAAAGETHRSRMIGTHPMAAGFVDTHFLERAPALAAALASLRCPLKTARLMRLTAGSAILEHDDFDPDAVNGTARLHIPIVTNDAVTFFLNRRPVPMRPGEIWYLRLSDPHSVTNHGASDRIHLVVDVRLNDWLLKQLRTGVA
ncbi:MAG TPA: aspartyl/asparaginyl beta-hydroxylase domain-containing protein [Allosphingosinicella sp.]|nr:aspartyl/asparaginyl beta-hydroxylase domain-containing protein [Allosphingosinicella sp.]